MKNITDYLIEEVSAEEEELLGSSGGAPPEEPPKEGNPAEINVERDEKLVKVGAHMVVGAHLGWGWEAGVKALSSAPQVLDQLLLYLRVVHSLDYYNTCEYPNEDEMPNRCGIIHVRGPMPPNRISHGEGECLSLLGSACAPSHRPLAFAEPAPLSQPQCWSGRRHLRRSSLPC